MSTISSATEAFSSNPQVLLAAIVALTTILIVVGMIAFGIYYSMRDHRWHPYQAIRTKQLIDGRSGNGPLMRRRVGKQWQYRSMSPNEKEDWDECKSW